MVDITLTSGMNAGVVDRATARLRRVTGGADRPQCQREDGGYADECRNRSAQRCQTKSWHRSLLNLLVCPLKFEGIRRVAAMMSSRGDLLLMDLWINYRGLAVAKHEQARN